MSTLLLATMEVSVNINSVHYSTIEQRVNVLQFFTVLLWDKLSATIVNDAQIYPVLLGRGQTIVPRSVSLFVGLLR